MLSALGRTVHMLSNTLRLAALLALFAVMPVHAALNVLACEPEWAALAVEIGGEHVKVTSATTAMQDPHHIQARPSLIAKARRADMIICSGAGLEAGWLPLLLQKSANPKIQPGKSGHFMATDYVELLGKVSNDPKNLHAEGNPHVHFDPQRLLAIAAALADLMAQLDKAQIDDYQGNLQAFSDSWNSAIPVWQSELSKISGSSVVVHHDSWVYLLQWAGIQQVATLEPKHGVPPSSSYLAGLLKQLKTQPASMIIRSGYEDKRPSQWLSEKSGLPVVSIPFSVSEYQSKGSLKRWMDKVIQHLIQGE